MRKGEEDHEEITSVLRGGYYRTSIHSELLCGEPSFRTKAEAASGTQMPIWSRLEYRVTRVYLANFMLLYFVNPGDAANMPLYRAVIPQEVYECLVENPRAVGMLR